MLITDKKIRKLVKERNLIAPFSEELLQSESYDVTIGNKIVLFTGTPCQITGLKNYSKTLHLQAFVSTINISKKSSMTLITYRLIKMYKNLALAS